MSDAVTTSVEVAVAPEVAFDVFTREIDAWYRVDQETLPDLTRTAAIRFEPYLGGRLLDVHDSASAEGRELGRITRWERGRRLAFVDNEGTEIDVSFDPSGAGTRVTLTHRGLDRISATRAAQLRRKGWTALVPFYRDHIAPNARPAGLAIAFFAIAIATLSVGTFIAFRLADGKPAVAAIVIGIAWIAIASAFLVRWGDVEWRAASRLVRSRWQYRRISTAALGVFASGLLINGIRNVIAHGEDPFDALYVPLMLLWVVWLGFTEGPAAQWNARKRKASATSPRLLNNPSSLLHPRIRAFLASHRALRLFLLLTVLFALVYGFSSLIVSLGDSFARAFFVLFLLGTLVCVRSQIRASKRPGEPRDRKSLGFDPDYFLSVERRVSEQGCRPEVLIHKPSGHPEFSGWCAYADDQAHVTKDFVTWSVEDLVNHTPETAVPLRHGHGRWKWNDRQKVYQAI